jgi:hypothetical protein
LGEDCRMERGCGGGGRLFQSEGAIFLKEQPVSSRLEVMGGRTSVMKEGAG